MDYVALAEKLQQKFPDDLRERVNIEQMFTLIDRLLPVEICLHYQVLPLFTEGRRLHLGMVFPNDRLARDYSQKIAAYLNYGLVSEPIPASVLQATLSAYLKYNATPSAQRSAPPSTALGPVAPEAPQAPSHSYQPNSLTSSGAASEAHPQAIQPQTSGAPDTETTPSSSGAAPKALEQPENRAGEAKTYVLDSPPTYLDSPIGSLGPRVERLPAAPAVEPDVTQPTLRLEETEAPQLPALTLNIRYPELPFEQLRDLRPHYLLPELLGRALAGSISRLYFEAQATQGRILLSDNGVVRAAIDAISHEQLRGVLRELKRLIQLPVASINSVRHAELEYRYGDNNVLLRTRVTTNSYGESAMLQVLQGSALKIYQRQKLLRVGHETIEALKQAQLRVSEFSGLLEALPDCPRAANELLGDLARILQGTSQQVVSLQQTCQINPQSPSAD
ncbi:MAG: hypothetical protein AAF289_14590 [Cyanobacteria bacterium P01_A01_bin.135]